MTERGKDISFTIMILLNFIVNLEYAYQTPFYPDLAINAGLSYSLIGVSISFSSFGQIFLSIPLSKLTAKIGRKKALFISIILQFADMVLGGTLQFVAFNSTLFFIAASFDRFIQGACRTLYIIAVCNYIDAYFPDEFQKRFSKFEMFAGFGTLSGFLIGSGLNLLMGYAGPLYIYSVIFAIVSVVLYRNLVNDDIKHADRSNKPQLTYKIIFKSASIIFLILDGLYTLGSVNYCNTVFVNHMRTYGIGKNLTALIIVIPGIVNVIFLFVVPRLNDIVFKEFTLSFGLLLNLIGILLCAPFWGISSTSIPFIIGLTFIGASFPFQRIPTIPQQMDNLQKYVRTDKQTLNAMASSLLTLQIGITNLIMPVMGGNIYDLTGGNINGAEYPIQERTAFRWTVLIFAIQESVVWIGFFFFAQGYKGWINLFKKCSQGSNQNSGRASLLTNNSPDSMGKYSDQTSSQSTTRITQEK